MFLRAGFNRRFKALCMARAVRGGRVGWVFLVRFQAGDLAWLGFNRVGWNPPNILNLIDPCLPPSMPYSVWPRVAQGRSVKRGPGSSR